MSAKLICLYCEIIELTGMLDARDIDNLITDGTEKSHFCKNIQGLARQN